MLLLFARGQARIASACRELVAKVIAVSRQRRLSLVREDGQTTAEYALVILAAAAVAVVLISWAKSSGKLPEFFDKVIDDLMGNT
jgi:Flp pilus assembly pilin Flp